jgi:signal transduction histidine kinase/putative methionine-R-sulfoxide reductase with GAF domain
MNVHLERWLTEQKDRLLSRWIDSLTTVVEPVNGGHDGVVAASKNNYFVESPFAESQHSHVAEMLANIYDGLILAAQGDQAALQSHVQQVISVNGNQQIRLPDLLKMPFHFRQIAWDVFQQEQDDPAATFALLHDLETLLEYTIDTMAHLWQQTTETEISERIEQAEFIAESMAAAIEQADRTALQLSSLNEASQHLASSLEDAQTLINQVGKTLHDLMGVCYISIWLPEEQTRNEMYKSDFCPVVLLSVYNREHDHLDENQTMTLSTASEQDILVQAYTRATNIYTVKPDPQHQGPWYKPGCAVIALPLLVKERAAGVVVLQDPNPDDQFSRSQQDLGRAVVNQAAIAIENARLYAQIRKFNSELEELVDQRTSELQEEKERLATIHKISTEISSTLDLDMLLNTSLQALARITHVEYGSIMLVEPDTGHLVNRAVLGHETMNTFTRFPIGQGVAGWVALHKEPALIDDIEGDERWVALPTGETELKYHGSMVAVPLIAQGEVWGVLILSHSHKGFFNEGHLRLLTASAGAIAVGINNANMYTTIFSEMERNSVLLQRQHMETSKMEAILQSLSDGVLVCDTEGGILSANPAAGRILERDLEELYFGNISLFDMMRDLLGGQLTEMPLDDLLMNPLDNHQNPRIFETTVEVSMRVISLTMGPVLKDGSELIGALLLMHDITREVEADRLKTEFIGTMSHELRTPMTAIKGFTQLLAMGGLGPVNDTQREFLTTIQNNAERMISIINDVLDITKIETGSIDLELRSIHLAEAISGVMTELQTLSQNREHTVSMSIPPGLPLVVADDGRLHQILYNIVSNALKYTPMGGDIGIEAHEATYDTIPEKVRQGLSKNRRYVQMNVSDTGVGVAPHELDLIFDRFYRTENQLKVEAGGTGLGLSLVKPLIELLGGRIWVESVLNEGSTFSFVLPVPEQ